MVETLTLVVGEKEKLVFDDWPADATTEHVPAQLWFREFIARSAEFIFPLVGVQHIVAEVLPNIAMEPVGSRFDGGVDDSPLEVAELCGCVARDQVELLDRVRSWCVPKEVVGHLIVVHAV